MVEQDVSVEDQDPDVEDEEACGQAGGGEGVGEVPHGEEAEGDHGAAEQRAAAPHAEEGVVVVEVPGLLEGVRAVVSRGVAHRRDHHLAQGRVHVEEECSVDVPGGHLAEVGLIPAHPGGGVNLKISKIMNYDP